MAYSKYKNCKTEIDGFKFGSKAEANRYLILSSLQRSGLIKGLVMQVKYPLISNQRKDDNTIERGCAYIADFVYIEEGKLIIEDVKGGKSTPEFIIKRKLMLEKHGITIREIRK